MDHSLKRRLRRISYWVRQGIAFPLVILGTFLISLALLVSGEDW